MKVKKWQIESAKAELSRQLAFGNMSPSFTRYLKREIKKMQAQYAAQKAAK